MIGPMSGSLKRRRGMGALGQTASTALSPGTTVTMNFSLPVSASIAGLSPSEEANSITNILAAWAPFANQILVLAGVTVASDFSSFAVTFVVGSTSYTYGLIAQGISTTVGTALGMTINSLDAFGLGTNATSFLTQFEQAGGLDLNPLSSLNLQTDMNAIKSALSLMPSWSWTTWAMVGGAVVVGALLIKKF